MVVFYKDKKFHTAALQTTYIGRSSWRGKALILCSAVAMVALLCIVGMDGRKQSVRGSLSFTQLDDGNNNNGGKTIRYILIPRKFKIFLDKLVRELTMGMCTCAGTTGEVAHTGGASDFIDTADLGDYVDAIIGPVSLSF